MVSRGAFRAKIVSSNLATPTKNLPFRRFFVMHHTVYILHSDSCKKFYTGQTQDLDNRLIEHNSGETTSLKPCIPWSIVWKTDVATRAQAMILEKKIKCRGAARFLADLGIKLT